MEEDILSGNFSSGTLFSELDEDEIPDTAIAKSPSTPKVSSLEIANLTGDEPSDPEDGEPKLELSPSDVERLTVLRNTVADNSAVNNSEEGLVELIDAQIAETAGTRVASQFNGVPEEGIGDDDDDDDDDDGGSGVKVGSDNDDVVIGTTADESMYGKRGKDTLVGGGGKDTLYGGKDNDKCEGGDDDDDIKGDLGDDDCEGGDGDDKVRGGKGKDTLKGGSGNDTCAGDDDDDVAYGNDGKDDCEGGAGNDSLYGGKGDDTCEGGTGNDTVSGDRGNDKCDGEEGDDSVGGGGGNDTLVGGGGNDTCSGDEGDDSVGGGTGNDTLVGGGGNDSCSGDDGDDSVGGGTGNDTLIGGGGNDKCDGDDGDDSVGGGTGNDTLVGGGGNDSCSGDEGDDSVGGGSGNDTLVGGGGNDTCVSGDGNDMVDGGDGDDSVVGGGGGNDTLMGGNNNDTLVGGTGDHTCIGGAGNDVFVMENRTSPGGISVITDYADGLDKFLLHGGLSFSSLFFVQVGLNTEIRVSGNFLLAVLLNVSATILEVSDFLTVGGGGGNIPGGNNNNNNNNNNTTPTPTNTPPQAEANRTLSLGGGTTQVISSDFLRFFDREQGFNGTQFTITDLPATTTGQLFYKGVAVTQVGLTFTQTDITLGLLSFRAAVSFSGAASFGFSVSDGTNVVVGQRFSFNVIQTSFNFAGSTVPQTITGSEFDDTIVGGDADDSITGVTGKDKVKGAKGNDTIKGNADDDDIEGDDGDDNVEGGAGKDTIKGGLGKDKIKGDDDDDDIDSGDDDDDVEGGSGKEKIKLGKGKDKAKGDDGDDDIDGGDDDDTVEGGTGNDTVVGGIGNDNVTGGDGDDSIEGGEGTNTLIGGPGRDRFIYRVSRQEITTVVQADLITDFSATDDILEFSSAAFANLSVASLTRLSINTAFTGAIGSANLLDFSADVSVTSIATLQARFTALGGSPGPVFCQFTDASTGGTVVVFSIGARFEVVARFSAVISLQISNFAFVGPTLNVPTGTSGPDILNFGTFPSGVTFSGFAGDDSISGSNFDDSILGGDGNDFIDGKNGKERLSGGAGNDRLFGGDADDTITGDEGDDSINGGVGFDVLTGGSGADIFSYTTTKEGGDKITDFTSGTDKFQFVSSNFGNITGSNFDLVNVTGTSTDITGKELLLFSGTFASLAAVQAQIGTTVGGGTAPFFGLYKNTAGESVLFFDADGTGSGSAVTVANLGTGVTSLGSADFVFTGTIAPPAAVAGNSTVDLNGNSTFPAGSNDFSSNPGGYGFSGPVLFTGNAGDNKVTGTAFADFLSGASGADLLNGGSGTDTLNGGPGPDTLTGGLGGDVFIYSGPADGPDTITDFTFGVDKLSFTASVFGNLTTANFDGVSGVSPDITGKELVIFTGGTFASFDDAQTTATGSSTSPGFFAFTNAADETVLVFDSNGTIAGGFTTVANLGTAVGSLGTGDFLFTGSIANTPVNTSTSGGSIADLSVAGNTFPSAVNNFGSGAGGLNFTSPVLFTGNASNNSVTATQFADILSGGSGADIFDGGLGDDSMSGDEGDDSLFGGGGSDTLTGGTGNDTLIGGAGTNVLNGGAGEDVFVFTGTSVGGGDSITNYSTADDLIALDSSAFAGFATGTLGLNFYTYSTALTVSAIENTLSGPSIIALYDGANTKLYYDSNGSTVGGSSLFATVNNVDLGLTGNAELFLF